MKDAYSESVDEDNVGDNRGDGCTEETGEEVDREDDEENKFLKYRNWKVIACLPQNHGKGELKQKKIKNLGFWLNLRWPLTGAILSKPQPNLYPSVGFYAKMPLQLNVTNISAVTDPILMKL